MSPSPMAGYWLPRAIRAELISERTEYAALSFAAGQPCAPEAPGAVTARWPRWGADEWGALLERLAANRERVPRGAALWARLQEALRSAAPRFADPLGGAGSELLRALPAYTGYSPPMIAAALRGLDMFALDDLAASFDLRLTHRAAREWQPMEGLAGRALFTPRSPWRRALCAAPWEQGRALWGAPQPADLVVGYGAGNVPGTALLILFLALAATLAGGPAPVVVVKNSRREPLFTPLVLDALEAADPDLLCATAVLVWDYEEREIEDLLLGRADLVIAAASDETIAQIRAQMEGAAGGGRAGRPPYSAAEGGRAGRPPYSAPRARLHAHGHKVSFSAIGKEMLAQDARDPQTGQPLADIAALLAALDSALWDQNGCLSSRIHFVEEGGAGYLAASDYAERLAAQLGILAARLPRGAWPLRHIHDRFDRYKALEATGRVQVLSRYDDEFLVLVDRRELAPAALYSLVNDCQGRVVVVRPVANLMEVPNRYLRMLPPGNLQSLSVAVGRPGEGLSEPFLRFAAACARRGVTAIRTVGRGAFPQLAYSWDGLLPQDLVRQRPAGHFSTIEFDAPLEQILATYRMMQNPHGDH